MAAGTFKMLYLLKLNENELQVKITVLQTLRTKERNSQWLPYFIPV